MNGLPIAGSFSRNHSRAAGGTRCGGGGAPDWLPPSWDATPGFGVVADDPAGRIAGASSGGIRRAHAASTANTARVGVSRGTTTLIGQGLRTWVVIGALRA